MPSIDRPDPVILEHVLKEHRDLHARIVAVREPLRAASGRPPTAAECKRLKDRLADLRDHLGDHFRREEEGGFLEESQTRLPRLSGEVRSLLAEHSGLLAELDALAVRFANLIERLPLGDSAAEDWRGLAEAFESFSLHLVDHERHENMIVQQGYNEDLGLTE